MQTRILFCLSTIAAIHLSASLAQDRPVLIVPDRSHVAVTQDRKTTPGEARDSANTPVPLPHEIDDHLVHDAAQPDKETVPTGPVRQDGSSNDAETKPTDAAGNSESELVPPDAPDESHTPDSQAKKKPKRPDRLQRPYLEEIPLRQRKSRPSADMGLSPASREENNNESNSARKPINPNWDPQSDAPLWVDEVRRLSKVPRESGKPAGAIPSSKETPAGGRSRRSPANKSTVPENSIDEGDYGPAIIVRKRKNNPVNSSRRTESGSSEQRAKPIVSNSNSDSGASWLSLLSGILSKTSQQEPTPSADPISSNNSQMRDDSASTQRTIPAAAVTSVPRMDRSHKVLRPTTSGPPFYNLHILATESFANRMIARNESFCDGVTDVILGAQVRGQQQTDTQITVDFRPACGMAHVDFRLQGTTRSETTGVLSVAAVDTSGRHRFKLVKPAYFDGRRFKTVRPGVMVDASNTPRNVRTTYSNLPLIGQLAQDVAWRQVQQTKSQTEQIAAYKVSQRVVPEFNGRIDKVLGRANRRLRVNYFNPLQKLNLQPDDTYMASSEKYVRFSAGVRTATPILQDQPPSTRPYGSALSVYLHESLVGSLLQRMDLTGLTISDQQLKTLVAALPSAIRSSSLNSLAAGLMQADTAELYSIVIKNDRPVWMEVDNGQLLVHLQFGIQPALGEEIPEQHIVIPFGLACGNGQLMLTPGTASIEPADGQATAGLATKTATTLLKQRLQSYLEPMALPATFNLSGNSSVAFRIRDVQLKDGWLMLALDQNSI